MEIQLKELIDQIKKDGVEAAEAEAQAILKAANDEAEKIIRNAQTEAERIMQNAKKENERMVRSSEDAIRQAGRNLLISFRESVARELKAIVGENVNAVYSSDAFAGLIISIVKNWANNPDAEDIAVILNTQDLDKLEETLLSALKDKMLKGITLKGNDNFDGGFRIVSNAGDDACQSVHHLHFHILGGKKLSEQMA